MIRAFPAVLMVAATFTAAGCRNKDHGAPRVIVIGDKVPDLTDRGSAPADSATAILRSATAQGLVRLDGNAQIESGLAERWNVSDDGLSYIFRLQSGEWPDGKPIRAREVARLLTRQLGAADAGPVRDAAGAIDEVVAMTDRVIEIRLKAPRPNLLTLLAQPEFALVHDGGGSGPFSVEAGDGNILRLIHRAPGFDGEPGSSEEVELQVLPAAKAVEAFKTGDVALVLGGTVADLPTARNASPARGALQFDPAAGLFGIMPGRETRFTQSAEVRTVLNQAIDRQALIAALDVPGLGPRATLLEAGLNGIAPPLQPDWLAVPAADRRAALKARLAPALPKAQEGTLPKVTVWLPEGAGGDMIFARLAIDWGALGLAVERAKSEASADFRFVDEVAPSDSAAWFVRRFRCDVAPVCSEDVDQLTEDARTTLLPEARSGLLTLAAQKVDGEALFMPIAAPIRWSLVSRTVPGFATNRYARHSLVALTSAAVAAR